MKHLVIIFILVVTKGTVAGVNNLRETLPRYVAIQRGLHYFDYKEGKKHQQIMSKKGLIPNIGAYMTIPIGTHRYFIQVYTQASSGVVEYKGSYIGREKNKIYRKSDDKFFERKVIVGRYMGEKEEQDIYYYIGYAYRSWKDKIRGHGTYKRNTTYHMIPIGSKITRHISKKWKYQFYCEYRYLVSGLNQNHLEQSNPFQWPSSPVGSLTFRQKSGYGIHSELTFNRLVTTYMMGISIFFNYFHIEASLPERTFIEPENETTEMGIKVSWAPTSANWFF